LGSLLQMTARDGARVSVAHPAPSRNCRFAIKETTMSSPHDISQAEPRIVRSTVEARKGVSGHNVRYVLGFGIVAVVIAFAVIYAVYFA
jgi:hypothetical protein